MNRTKENEMAKMKDEIKKYEEKVKKVDELISSQDRMKKKLKECEDDVARLNSTIETNNEEIK